MYVWDEGKGGVRSNVGNDTDIRFKRKINFREKGDFSASEHVRIMPKRHQSLMFFSSAILSKW